MKTALVIGAGISGLASSFRLQQLGYDVTVLESSSEIGGALQTYDEHGFRTESGPHSLRIDSSFLEDLFNTIGLQPDIISTNPSAHKRYVVKDAQLHAFPSSPLKLLTTPLLSFRGKLKLLLEPFRSRLLPNDQLSLAALMKHRLGQECVDYFLNPFIAGIYAGNPEILSSQYTFAKISACLNRHRSFFNSAWYRLRHKSNSAFKPRIISFKKGMHQLPEALNKTLLKPALLNCKLQALQYSQSKWSAIWTQTNIVHKGTFDTVIMAVPAYQLEMLPVMDIQLADSLKQLSTMPYAGINVLTLGFKQSDIPHALEGFGFLVPEKETSIPILGALFNSSMFPNRAPEGYYSLSVFIGGSRHPEHLKLPIESILQIVQKALSTLLGIQADPVFKKYTCYTKAIPQYLCGHQAYLDLIKHIEKAFPELIFTGNYLQGISVGQSLEQAYTRMHTI